MLVRRLEKRTGNKEMRDSFCPWPSLRSLKFTNIHKMVLRGFTMGLTQMELDSVLAGKSPVTQFTLIWGASWLLIWGRGGGKWVRTGVGDWMGQRMRLRWKQFLRKPLAMAWYLANEMLSRQLGQVPEPEAQMWLKMADIGRGGTDLWCTVTAEEYRVARV